MNYEIRELKHRRKITKQLPGRLNLFVSALNQLIELKDLYFGDSRIKDLSGVNFFLQTDQSQSSPTFWSGSTCGITQQPASVVFRVKPLYACMLADGYMATKLK